MTNPEGNTQGTSGLSLDKQEAAFRFSPASIGDRISKELGIRIERIEKRPVYAELFDLKSQAKDGKGNTFYRVDRDGTVHEYDNNTKVLDIATEVMESCLVVKYYSSKGDTAKIYMGKDLRANAPASISAMLLSDEEE